jgi:hypothetical protein
MFQMGARENATYEERLSNQQTDFTGFALATFGYATKRSGTRNGSIRLRLKSHTKSFAVGTSRNIAKRFEVGRWSITPGVRPMTSVGC